MLIGIEGQPPRPGRRPVGCSFAPRCGFAATTAGAATEPLPTDFAGQMVRCLPGRQPGAGKATAGAARSSAPPRPPPRRRSSRCGDVAGLHTGRRRCSPAIDLDVPRGALRGRGRRVRLGEDDPRPLHRRAAPNWTGTITFDGEDRWPTGGRPRAAQALRRIQYVFQNPYTSLNPRKTVGQILDQPLGHFFDLSSAERSQRVADVLEEVSLSPEFTSPLPRRALRRGAPAGRDRPRPDRRTRRARLRRGDLGARRLGPGGDRRAAPRPAARSAASR